MQDKECKPKNLEYELNLRLLRRLSPELAQKQEYMHRARVAVSSDDFLKPIWLNLRPASRFPIKEAAALSCGINPEYAWVIDFPVAAEGTTLSALSLAQERLDFLKENRSNAVVGSISLSELARLLLAEDESAYLPVEFPGRRPAAAPGAHQSCGFEARQSATQDTPALNLSTPSSPAKGEKAEAAIDRQDRRLAACLAKGLKMPTDEWSHLPAGVGQLAKLEGVTRQAFSQDVRAALSREYAKVRAGFVRHSGG